MSSARAFGAFLELPPFVAVEDVVAGLAAVETALRVAGDRCGPFASAYLAITLTMR